MPRFISPQMLSPTLIGAAAGFLSGSPASPVKYPTYGLTMRFAVTVDDLSSLGTWASCKGLHVEFKTKPVTQGGDYNRTYALPDRLEYDRITLERAMNKTDSHAVADWLGSMKNKWMTPAAGSEPAFGPKEPPGTATISLLDPTQPNNLEKALFTWTLRNVLPVSWSGPSFSAKGSDVALETLVLQHGGFL